MKKSFTKVLSTLICTCLGVLLFNFSISQESSQSMNNWCWSADDVLEGAGYYRCKPDLDCYWVDNRTPEGDADLCEPVIQ